MDGDVELLHKWRDGDADAGRRLLERHFDGLYRFFSSKVQDEIDDLVQSTMLACVRYRDALAKSQSFKAYLFTIARNQLFRHLERIAPDRERLELGTVSMEDLGTTPSARVARAQEEGRLLMSLRQLPLDLQIVLELHYWEDLSTAELAEVLEIPQGTVKSRLRRAREQLGEALSREPGPRLQGDELQTWITTQFGRFGKK